MVVIETDVPMGEEAIHPMTQDEVFRHATLQAFALGEEPEAVGEDEGLFDVVGRKEDGLLLFDGQPMEQVHDFDTAHHIEEGRRLVEENERTFLYQRLGDHYLLTFTI